MNKNRIEIALALLTAVTLTGCVSQQIKTKTENLDQAGNVLSTRTETVRVRGLLASSKKTGLAGSITFDNAWSTNKAALTNNASAAITLSVDSTESDVSDKAADVLKAPSELINP